MYKPKQTHSFQSPMPGKTIKKTSPKQKVVRKPKVVTDDKSTKCTKEKVFNGRNHITKTGKKRVCKQTPGGLKKEDLTINKVGKVVSIKKQRAFKKGPLKPKSRRDLILLSGLPAMTSAHKSKLLQTRVTAADEKAARESAKAAYKMKTASAMKTRSQARKAK